MGHWHASEHTDICTKINQKLSFSASPTKQSGGSRLEMFSNVKNQIEGIGGWLGSSIPKLRKGETEGLTDAQEPIATETVAPASAETGPVKDEDDNSR